MIRIILAFQSTGDAVAGERKLLDAGVDVRTMPAPKTLAGICGICLAIDPADLGRARLILGDSIRGVYREGENLCQMV